MFIFAAIVFLLCKILKCSILSSSFIAIAISYIFYELVYKRRRLPAGPTPWLVAGNMLSFITTKSIDELFLKWKQQFGPIFTVWIGPIPLVMVADLPTIRRYFITHADYFSNRWRNYVTDTIMEGANGVVQIDGDKWRDQRRFALHTLRDFGVGRPLMEHKIITEVEALTTHLSEFDGKSIKLSSPVAICVGNIINNMLFGVRFEQGDARMHKLHNLLDEQSQIVMKAIMGAYIAVPWTTRVPIINGEWKRLMRVKQQLVCFLRAQMDDHFERWSDDMLEQELEDLTFAYIREMKTRGAESFFDEKQLEMLLLDLFFAGMETTVTTLKWAFLLVARHPHVQRRLHDEIDVLGVQQVRLEHRAQLTYTLATINEIQRVANILPVNLLRTVAEDIQLDGFAYQRGDLVIPQISILMNDPAVFAEPAEFNPSRFIDAETGALRKIDEFLPFSIGRRQCLGESLARAELFLIFANLVRSFTFHVDADVPNKRVLGLTVSPPSYECRIARRHVDSNSNSL